MYNFKSHLITLVVNRQLPVPVSHQHKTFCSEMRTKEITQLRMISPHNHQEFEAKISINILSANFICSNIVSVII